MVCGSYAKTDTGLEGPFRNGNRSGLVDGIEVIELELPYSNKMDFLRRTWIFLRFAWCSSRLALTEKYDLIFATSTPLTVGIPGILARWLRGKLFVFEVRDLWPELPKAMKVITNPLVLWGMSVLEWLSYHSAHRIVSLAPGVSEVILRRGVSQKRVCMIPNGCDLNFFAQQKPPWRPEGISEEDLLAVFTGAHGLANGLDALLDVAYELKRRGTTGIILLLVGDGMLKPKLKQRAQNEGLNNVVFLEPMQKGQLMSLLKSADIGMQILANIPAFYNGTSPNKFFDYLAVGLPVLNNYPGWLAELITQEDCGFVVPPENPQAFADALEQAANDRAALKEMGTRAYELAKCEFDREKQANCFVDWLEGVKSHDQLAG